MNVRAENRFALHLIVTVLSDKAQNYVRLYIDAKLWIFAERHFVHS